MDLGQQPAQTVLGAGDLAGQVVVEAHEHVQLGDGLVVRRQVTQSVRHGAGGIGDDRSVAGVGLRLAGVEVGDPPHRQSRQISDTTAGVAGNGQRQGADRGWLVHHNQHCPVPGLQLLEQLTQPRFTVGQRLVEHFLARLCQCGAVMLTLADVQTEVHMGLLHDRVTAGFMQPGLRLGS
ncbi:hypothetical protein SHKM778_31880 [Streptomyces sp. KM77-8]|uniref:Uncharacterized protein n=1 Tax=Streptomyces haneummycinicus TaxID=3074435 RepID=A0AAT9HHK6_9ACTN